MSDLDAFRTIDPSAFGAALDALVREGAGEDPPRRVTLFVERTGEDAFDADVIVDPHAPETGPYPRPVRAKLGGLDLARVHAAVAWTTNRGGNVAHSSRRWSKWESLSVEDRVREVARVLAAAPVRVVVACLPPASERGEPPMGQPSVVAELARDGSTFREYLVSTTTDPSTHEAVSNEIAARGRALAEALGVPCEVVR